MFWSGNYKLESLLAKVISGNECAFAILLSGFYLSFFEWSQFSESYENKIERFIVALQSINLIRKSLDSSEFSKAHQVVKSPPKRYLKRAKKIPKISQKGPHFKSARENAVENLTNNFPKRQTEFKFRLKSWRNTMDVKVPRSSWLSFVCLF